MKNKLLLLVALLLVPSVSVFGQATTNLAGEKNTVFVDGSESTVAEYPLQSVSVSTAVASTTAVTVTALTGRSYIEISAGDSDTMTNQIWVGVGTTTVTVGTGRLVTQDNPLKLPADDGIVFSTIASEAVPMCVIQGKH